MLFLFYLAGYEIMVSVFGWTYDMTLRLFIHYGLYREIRLMSVYDNLELLLQDHDHIFWDQMFIDHLNDEALCLSLFQRCIPFKLLAFKIMTV